MQVSRRIKSAFFTLLGAGAGTQLFLFAIAPLLTRLYAPEEFGGYGLAIAVCASLAAVSGGRMEFAIPSSDTEQRAKQLFVMTLLLACLSLGFVGLLVITSTYLNGNNPLIQLVGEDIAVLIPLGAFSIAALQATTFWLLWHKNYKLLARIRWMQCVSQSVVQGLGGVLGFGAWGLLIGHTIGQFAGVLGALRSPLIRPNRQMIRHTLLRLRRLVGIYKSYPITLGPATVANLLAQHLPVVLIGWIYGLSAAGIYAIAQRVCGAPLVLVGQAVSQLYVAEMPCLMQIAPQNAYLTYKKVVRTLLVIALVLCIALVVLAPYGAVLLFGESWGELGRLIQILATCFVLDFAVTPVSLTLNLLGRRGQQLRWDASRLAGVLAVFSIGFVYELEFLHSMVLLSLVLAASNVYLLFAMSSALRSWEARHIKSPFPAVPGS